MLDPNHHVCFILTASSWQRNSFSLPLNLLVTVITQPAGTNGANGFGDTATRMQINREDNAIWTTCSYQVLMTLELCLPRSPLRQESDRESTALLLHCGHIPNKTILVRQLRSPRSISVFPKGKINGRLTLHLCTENIKTHSRFPDVCFPTVSKM